MTFLPSLNDLVSPAMGTAYNLQRTMFLTYEHCSRSPIRNSISDPIVVGVGCDAVSFAAAFLLPKAARADGELLH